MARRGSEFHFARYHMEDENDCQAFRNAFSSLLKQIPLQVDHDTLIQRWWYFFEGSIGCIGILKQWLVRSFSLLLYHLLSTSTLPFWTIFFGVLSPILRWKRRHSGAPTVKALL